MTPASHTDVPVARLGCSVLNPFLPTATQQAAGDGSNIGVSATHMGDPNWIQDYWFQLGPALLPVCIWGVNSRWKTVSLWNKMKINTILNRFTVKQKLNRIKNDKYFFSIHEVEAIYRLNTSHLEFLEPEIYFGVSA